jgi:RNA polymerase sigma factor (sigma-70 family)
VTISERGSEMELATRAHGAGKDGVATERPEKEWKTSGGSNASLRSAPVPTLVQEAKDGNPAAWGELVARFGVMIAATGRRYRLTPADVAELQQTTWLRLVENIHRVEQPERIGGWLATTARRESLQLVRKAARYRPGADQMLANMPDNHLPEPDARPIAGERDAMLRAAWERLQPRCQEILSRLVSDDPVGYKDLSALLQMPVGSIGPTRARCLQHLRRLVEGEGVNAA